MDNLIARFRTGILDRKEEHLQARGRSGVEDMAYLAEQEKSHREGSFLGYVAYVLGTLCVADNFRRESLQQWREYQSSIIQDGILS